MVKEPMHIAHIVGKVQMAGVDAVVMNYYRHIDKKIIQFDFFMDGLDKTPIDDEILSMGGRIFKLPPYQQGMGKNLSTFRMLINENKYRIIHCHMNTLSIFWLREAKKAGIPIRIAHSHSTAGKGETLRNLIKYTLRLFSKVYASHYCACSHYAGRWLFGNYYFDSGKVIILRNAIDANAFEYKKTVRGAVRREFGIGNELVLGHAGRFMYQKNHTYLIKIFEQVHKLYQDSKLLLVGDGPLKISIEQMVKLKGLKDKVIFTGTRTDVPRIMQGIDCFVLPSRYEGLGLVAVEAQASGLLCYVSNEVPNEAILTNHCKSLSLKLAPELWARQIIDDLVEYKRSSDIRWVIEKGYNIEQEVKKLEEYYLSIVK